MYPMKKTVLSIIAIVVVVTIALLSHSYVAAIVAGAVQVVSYFVLQKMGWYSQEK